MDPSAFANVSNSFHQSRTNVYMPGDAFAEHTDSGGILHRRGESQCDALHRHRFGPDLAMLDQCIYELWPYTGGMVRAIDTFLHPVVQSGHTAHAAPDLPPLTPDLVREFDLQTAYDALVVSRDKHGRNKRLQCLMPVAGGWQRYPILKHRCGPHFCVWCGLESATAHSLCCRSMPHMSITCDHCWDELTTVSYTHLRAHETDS